MPHADPIDPRASTAPPAPPAHIAPLGRAAVDLARRTANAEGAAHYLYEELLLAKARIAALEAELAAVRAPRVVDGPNGSALRELRPMTRAAG